MMTLVALFMVAYVSASVPGRDSKPANSANAASISGVITDKASNEKLAGVLIQLTDTDMKVYTNSKGEFSISGVAPGTYEVKVNCISYRDKTVTVKIPGGKKEKLSIELNPIMP